MISKMEDKLVAVEKKVGILEKGHNSIQAELTCIKMLIVGIDSRHIKDNAGSNIPMVTEE